MFLFASQKLCIGQPVPTIWYCPSAALKRGYSFPMQSKINVLIRKTSRAYLFLNSLIEEGGDWDRRNRLKVYQGLYYLSIRDFKSAANNFLDSISTFTSYELMDYKTFVTYTVLASMIALERVDLRTKVRRV